ncbi:hypothetical protein K435DRAFT_124786 [Dendrothele bispora CBS 962.96]|uniref:Uncharacterized protein n=1 Tax=Dendrothele bispora (strain CBS 962.96) TaxID=1314807 RepID=A0A4S8M159_DENBC|nr:hypothetical protein K435DRAFT_124786 [Dendrothele bispora CBS 962.96]
MLPNGGGLASVLSSMLDADRHAAKSEDWEGEGEDAEKDEMEIEEVYKALMIDDDDESDNDGKDEDIVVVDASEKNRNRNDEIIESQTVRIAILESSLEETNSRLSTEIASNRVKIKRLRSLLEETVAYRDEIERVCALLRIRTMGDLEKAKGEKDVDRRSRSRDESKGTPGSESKWCERNRSLEKELGEVKEEREALKEQIKEKEERLTALEAVLKMEREEREKEDEESDMCTTRIRLEERISFMEHDIAVRVSTINVLAGHLEDTRQQVDDHKAIIGAKVESIQSLEREMREMKIGSKEKDKELERRRWEKRELKKRIDVLKKEVEKEKAKSESCRDQLKPVRDETSGLREKLGTAEGSMKKWMAASKMKDGELLAVNKRHQKLKREMELKSQALEAMTARARAAEDRAARYEVKMASYMADTTKKWEAKVALNLQEAENWRSKLVTVGAQSARQREEMKKLKEGVLGCERRCERYRAERDELREKNQTLESRLAGHQQSYQRHSGSGTHLCLP